MESVNHEILFRIGDGLFEVVVQVLDELLQLVGHLRLLHAFFTGNIEFLDFGHVGSHALLILGNAYRGIGDGERFDVLLSDLGSEFATNVAALLDVQNGGQIFGKGIPFLVFGVHLGDQSGRDFATLNHVAHLFGRTGNGEDEIDVLHGFAAFLGDVGNGVVLVDQALEFDGFVERSHVGAGIENDAVERTRFFTGIVIQFELDVADIMAGLGSLLSSEDTVIAVDDKVLDRVVFENDLAAKQSLADSRDHNGLGIFVNLVVLDCTIVVIDDEFAEQGLIDFLFPNRGQRRYDFGSTGFGFGRLFALGLGAQLGCVGDVAIRNFSGAGEREIGIFDRGEFVRCH